MNTAIIMGMMFNTEMIVKDMKGGKEDMTEKRFTTDNGSNEDVCLVDNLTGVEYESNFEDVVDLLNDLNDENKNLSKLNKILEGFLLNKGYDFKDIITFLHERIDERDD